MKEIDKSTLIRCFQKRYELSKMILANGLLFIKNNSIT